MAPPSQLVQQGWKAAGALTMFVRALRAASDDPVVQYEGVELATALARIADQLGEGVKILRLCSPGAVEAGGGTALDLAAVQELVSSLVDEHRATVGRRLDMRSAQEFVAQVIGQRVLALDAGLSRLGYGLSVEVVEMPHREGVWSDDRGWLRLERLAGESSDSGDADGVVDGVDVDGEAAALEPSGRPDPLGDGGRAVLPVQGRVSEVDEIVAGVPFH